MNAETLPKSAVLATAPVARMRATPVVVAALAAFAGSLLWYSPLLFGEVVATLDPTPPPPAWAMAFAPLREFAASYVVARLLVRSGGSGWRQGAALGAFLWLGFHAVMMSGAALFSGMPPPVALVHAGDWLMKLVLMGALLGGWLPRARRA